MAITVADLQARMGADISGFASGMAQARKQAEDTERSLSDKFKSAGQSMTAFGKKATVAVTLPLVGVGVAAFNAASDVNESLSKVNVVFGESAAGIDKWSQTAATSMGIARQEALESAGTFGNLFRALGLNQTEAAGMSTKIVGLASDLASFNNANPEDVLLALRAGLVGEAEPLRKFGVSLSAARVEAEAMSSGLVKASVNLGKVKAAQFAVDDSLRKLAAAQAEFGEGSNEAASASLKVEKAQADLAKAMAGSKVELTAAQKAQASFAVIMKDTALAQGDFARTADGAANQQRILSAQFKDAAAVLGKHLLPIALDIMKWLSDMAERFGQLSPGVQKFILIAAGLLAVLGPIVAVAGALATVVGAIGLPVLAVVAAIAAVIAVGYLLYKHWDEIKAFAADTWSSITAAVGSAVDAVVRFVSELPGKVLGFFASIPGRVGAVLSALPGIAGAALGQLIAAFITAGVAIVGWLHELPGRALSALVELGPVLLRAGWAGMLAVREGMIAAWGHVWGFITSLPGRIIGVFANAPEWLVHVGKNVVIGFWNGLVSLASWIKDKTFEFFKGLLGPIGKALGLGSPSKITAQYGAWLAEGLAAGMLGESGAVRQAAGMLAAAALPQVAAPAFPSGGAAAMAGFGVAAGGGGGGQVVNITVNAGVGDPVAIGEAVERVLARSRRRGVGSG